MAEVPSIAFERGEHSRFYGAKVTVFVGSRIVTILRDDIPDIPWPGYWDLPGGGRENGEGAWDCAVRECREETSLALGADDLLWGRRYRTERHDNWFFVAQVAAKRTSELLLGTEGQELRLMSVKDYLIHPKAIPNFQQRLADWVARTEATAEYRSRCD